ncbi:hypothetical protein [Selenomonas bovis]|uniref:hypothetical protein n=1 Tax=Selenomonas bovis TaxID=416586 RepID=UPI003D002A38
MRRAQVEKVDGRHVFVDGRWLTCIGNRLVSPGDRVWTDGRCVYGNEQEGGGGSVMTSGWVKGIPILIYHQFYLLTHEKIQRIGRSETIASMIHRKNHVAYFSEKEYVVDADMDSQGNLYALSGAHGIEHIPAMPDDPGPQDFTITVRKNQKILHRFDFSRSYEQVKQECFALRNELSLIDRDTYSPSLYGDFSCWNGYVDCDGHWSAWLLLESSGELQIYSQSAGVIKLYYIADGNMHLLMDTRGQLVKEKPCIIQTKIYFDGVIGQKFPIQDGYYFTMKPHQPVWWRIGLPRVAVCTIFTPDNEAIFTGQFYMIPRFGILPLGKGRYLLDVNHRLLMAFEMVYRITGLSEDMTHIAPGIYLLENGSLTLLLEGRNDAFRLRYLKDYRKWVHSIQGKDG